MIYLGVSMEEDVPVEISVNETNLQSGHGEALGDCKRLRKPCSIDMELECVSRQGKVQGMLRVDRRKKDHT